MSTATLQRVAVRMLHDPRFCAAVYADAAAALADTDLSPTERAWLVAPDARRWRADAERPHRVLDALLREFPVACARGVARALRAAGPAADAATGAAALLGFFADAHFHQAISARGWLFEAFGRWLAASDSATAEAAQLETAVARARRDLEGGRWVASNGDAMLRPAPGVVGVVVPEGALQRYQAHLAALVDDGRPLPLAVLDPPVSLHTADPTPAAGALTGVLVEPGADGPSLGETSMEMAALFAALALGAPVESWAAGLAKAGAEPHEIKEIIDEWQADGLVIPGQT